MVWPQLLGDSDVSKSRLVSDLDDWMNLREETYQSLRARSFPDDINKPPPVGDVVTAKKIEPAGLTSSSSTRWLQCRPAPGRT